MVIQELVVEDKERERLFGALASMPPVKAKADWCIRWMESQSVDFGTRLVAFAIVEGVFFSSSFAAIFWVRSRGLLPGLCMSNELIARDEGMHTSFACLLMKYLERRAKFEVVAEMMRGAVDLEQRFFAGESLCDSTREGFDESEFCSMSAASVERDQCGNDAPIRGVCGRLFDEGDGVLGDFRSEEPCKLMSEEQHVCFGLLTESTVRVHGDYRRRWARKLL